MSSPRRTDRRTAHRAGLLAVAVVLCCSAGAIAEEPADGPGARVIDTVAGTPVTAAEADVLRALIAPPPSREKAERLAVDVTLVWWSEHGTLEGSTMAERLDGWRDWLAELRDSTEGPLGAEALRRLAAIRTAATPPAE